MAFVVPWYRAAMGASKKAANIVFVESQFDETDLATYNFTINVNGAIGDTVLLGIASRGTTMNLVINSVTLAGNAMTPQVTHNPDDSAGKIAAIYSYELTAATTTAALVIALNQTAARLGVGVWRGENLGSITALDTDTADGASPYNYTLNIPATAGAVGTSWVSVGPNTWTGLTKDYDDNPVSNNYFTGASRTGGTGSTAITQTHSGTAGVGAVASFNA